MYKPVLKFSLTQHSQGLGDLPVAERQLCGVSAFLKKYHGEQRDRIQRCVC